MQIRPLLLSAAAVLCAPACAPKRHALRPLQLTHSAGEQGSLGVPHMALLAGRVPTGDCRCRAPAVDPELVLEGRVERGPLGSPLAVFAPTALPAGTELSCACVADATGRARAVELVVPE